MTRAGALCILALLLFPASRTHAQLSPSTKVPWTKVPPVAVAARADDPRVQLSREGVDFWNRTLGEIGTPFRLGPVTHASVAIPEQYLAAVSATMMDRGAMPPVPESVRQMPADIIIALSDGDFVSFSARLHSVGKELIGIRTDRTPPLSLPNVARNVIAHELGHAIGLGHNSDPTKLMCGRPAPCRPADFASSVERFFPLTEGERDALLRMYPPGWPGGR